MSIIVFLYYIAPIPQWKKKCKIKEIYTFPNETYYVKENHSSRDTVLKIKENKHLL